MPSVGYDLSCLLVRPLTGVGYYTLRQLSALLDSDKGVEAHAFASRGGSPCTDGLENLRARCASWRTLRWPTRFKTACWTRVEWPPIEYFTGPVDIAHGMFHLLPASRKARRVVTVFDLTHLRQPDTHDQQSAALHTRMLRHAVRKADVLITISESSRRDLIEMMGAAPDRIRVVYGGMDPTEFEGPDDPERWGMLCQRHGIGRTYWIHVGTLEPRKNLVRLIEAWERIRAMHPACPDLVLAGGMGWKSEAIRSAISRAFRRGGLVHTGYLDRADVVTLLRGARGCLYPSLYEGFGLPVLEAMAAGVPVLTSSVSSLPEVAGDTALYVDPHDSESLMMGMLALFERPDEARERAVRGRERSKRFTWEASAASLRAVYRELCP